MAYSLYQPAGTFLHRADPAAKIVALAAWFLVVVLCTHNAELAALALASVALALAARLGRVLVTFARFVAVLLVMCALLWAIFSRDPAAGPGFVNGLARGAWVGLRLATLLGMGVVFLGSTRVEEMAAGLQRMGLPFNAVFSVTLAFRLLPLFAGSGATIVQAQACRGVDVREGSLLTRLRRYLPLLVPLVLSSLRTADGLAVALESRGLGMMPRRTSVLESRPGPWEVLAVAVSLGAAAAAVWARWAGWPVQPGLPSGA